MCADCASVHLCITPFFLHVTMHTLLHFHKRKMTDAQMHSLHRIMWKPLMAFLS